MHSQQTVRLRPARWRAGWLLPCMLAWVLAQMLALEHRVAHGAAGVPHRAHQAHPAEEADAADEAQRAHEAHQADQADQAHRAQQPHAFGGEHHGDEPQCRLIDQAGWADLAPVPALPTAAAASGGTLAASAKAAAAASAGCRHYQARAPPST
jgi:hypothetical protein